MEIKISFPGGKRVDAELGGHVIHTDQPASSGGEGSAPTPYDTFLAAIGTCAGIYVLGFCQARNIPTAGLRLTQRMDLDASGHHLDAVHLDLELPPGFPEQYVAGVRKAAEHCAVKKTILDPPRFEVRATVAGAAQA